MSIPNIWHLRRVADTASKACYICYKPSSSVLITPDNKDHFYVCPGHLKDPGFGSPIINEEEVAAKKKKEEKDKEIARVKKEYEEKQKKKKEKEKSKAKDKESKKDDKKEDKEAENSGDDKPDPSSSETKTSSSMVEEIPRVYALHRNLYQMRLDRIRNAELAKRNRERLKSPTTFPSVPQGFP